MSSFSNPATIASAKVSTRTVLSTNGIPIALARLKTGMTGRTSVIHCCNCQVRGGRDSWIAGKRIRKGKKSMEHGKRCRNKIGSVCPI